MNDEPSETTDEQQDLPAAAARESLPKHGTALRAAQRMNATQIMAHIQKAQIGVDCDEVLAAAAALESKDVGALREHERRAALLKAIEEAT